MKISLRDYLPLIYIYLLTIFISIIVSLFLSYNIRQTIYTFLGFFSLIFAILKLIRLKDFVEAFSEYDIFTQKFRFYGYIFPVLELIFGISFILIVENLMLEFLCLIIFLLNSISVILALQKNRKFVCACLGDLIKVPLSYVSLFENLTMILGIIYLFTH